LNTAVGSNCLGSNTTGSHNAALGGSALISNQDGYGNAAFGEAALAGNTSGAYNIGCGFATLGSNADGNLNIAIGFEAGSNLRRGSRNVYIANPGNTEESKTIHIGAKGNQTSTFIAGISGVTVAGGVGVVVDTNGQLGTVTSSARYKEAIEPMGKASDKLLSLQPMRFRYKKELDPNANPQFGLVAEDVAKVDPDLVACDGEGKPYSVRYEAVNAMLLNEFLKAHRKLEEQGAEIAELKAARAKQAAQIEKVSACLQSIPPLPRLVENR
jgi:Chaperone of endosialidase